MNSEEKQKAVMMHRNFFDQSKAAIESKYYFEAMMYEYAAIEGRLEIICGMLGCPCNRQLDDDTRRSIKIGRRITCLKRLYKIHTACKNSTTKINKEIWERIDRWIRRRNMFVHGLYKDPSIYTNRIKDVKDEAEEGYELARLLYNEAKRIKRLVDNHPERMCWEGKCCKKQCFKKW
ncbi:MAG: hypothetical protein IKF07_07610 [Eubacterium sp.]|nr:hypothetical protein [Eubacterium sp.]